MDNSIEYYPRPEKILKIAFEISRSDSVVRRLSTKWTLDHPFAENYMANFGRAGSPENDFAFVLLVKIRQLSRVGSYKEAKLLYQGRDLIVSLLAYLFTFSHRHNTDQRRID